MTTKRMAIIWISSLYFFNQAFAFDQNAFMATSSILLIYINIIPLFFCIVKQDAPLFRCQGIKNPPFPLCNMTRAPSTLHGAKAIPLCNTQAKKKGHCGFCRNGHDPYQENYPRSARSEANSAPLALENISRRVSTVSFFFSSPETSRMMRPAFIMIRRLPCAMASFIL